MQQRDSVLFNQKTTKILSVPLRIFFLFSQSINSSIKGQIKTPELLNQTEFIGKVHAVGEGGQILVVEYKDTLFPIFVKATEYTQGLFRGDIIRLSYKIQTRPQQPTHLQLNLEAEQPIEVNNTINPLETNILCIIDFMSQIYFITNANGMTFVIKKKYNFFS